jgi:hypothetical protein
VSELLAIYLRDHQAAARAAVGLAHRTAEGAYGKSSRRVLERVAVEIEDDLRTLERIMEALEVPPSTAKGAVAVVGERVGRLKLNGRILRRSPLSDVIELETLEAGITAKEALWRSLLLARTNEARLAPVKLERLIKRARSQREKLETCRLEAARAAFAYSS